MSRRTMGMEGDLIIPIITRTLILQSYYINFPKSVCQSLHPTSSYSSVNPSHAANIHTVHQRYNLRVAA
jgi:hypothetical protein